MAIEGKYGIVHTERGNIEEGEPVFILRGKDALAPEAIRFYASLRRKNGDEKGALECEAHAKRLEDWPVKKMPD